MLDGGRGEESVYHRRRMSGLAFRAAGDRAPSAHDAIAEREDAAFEPRLERMQRSGVARTGGIVGRKIVDALVDFGESEDTEKQAGLLLLRRPRRDARCSGRRNERADDVRVEQPADQNSVSRP
mgnify:CR=1 FL=1